MTVPTYPGLVFCTAALGLLAGCQPSAVRVQKPSVSLDPCAERLHDMCEQFLLYYSTQKHLPNSLDEMKAWEPKRLPPLVCPASGKPYVYRAEGVEVPGQKGRALLFDAEACHSGMRWAIVADAVTDEGPLTLRVRLLPDGAWAAGPQAAAAPRPAARSERARITAAKADIATIELALDVFEVDCGRYPTTEEGLGALLEQPASAVGWSGPYVRESHVKNGLFTDPWGSAYVYRHPGQHEGSDYDVYSLGPDGQQADRPAAGTTSATGLRNNERTCGCSRRRRTGRRADRSHRPDWLSVVAA